MANTNTKNSITVTIRFDAKLWAGADALRNKIDAVEHKHLVVDLVFLKNIWQGRCPSASRMRANPGVSRPAAIRSSLNSSPASSDVRAECRIKDPA